MMEITNAQYNKTPTTYAADGVTVVQEGINSSISCTIDGTDLCVPIFVGNVHYDEIMRQVAEGTLTIADAE